MTVQTRPGPIFCRLSTTGGGLAGGTNRLAVHVGGQRIGGLGQRIRRTACRAASFQGAPEGEPWIADCALHLWLIRRDEALQPGSLEDCRRQIEAAAQLPPDRWRENTDPAWGALIAEIEADPDLMDLGKAGILAG